jgi:predicted SprT family Zn-dependent metalloprotease
MTTMTTTQTMTLDDARIFALGKFSSNRLVNLTTKGWKVRFNNRKRAFGLCKSRQKVIELSAFLLPLCTAEQIKDTVLHEIAHAIDNEQRGYSNHDYVWKNIARSIGCTGYRVKTLSKEAREQISYKWEAHCENCGMIGGYQKRPKYLTGAKHRTCKGKITWKHVG